MQSSLRSSRFPLAARRLLAHVGISAISVALCAPLSNAQTPLRPEQPEELAARAICRAAILDLKLARPPANRDYRVAASVLETAYALAPREEQILRLLIEAQTGAGDYERVTKLNRSLVELDPQDTVAQLRLITGLITQQQTVEGRIAAYARFLGPEGESLDPSIRSRLALDAALLQRERGDITGFTERLTQALELDPTNKDAATLALSFYEQRIQDNPLGKLDLLLGVLYADPYDVNVHRAVAREMASAGAFNGARRFLNTLDRLYNTLGITPESDEQTFRQVVQWNLLGAETIARRLSDVLDDQRKDLLRKRNQPGLRLPAGEELPGLDDVRLPFTSERTRLLASSAVENREVARESMAELAETARRLAEQIADPSRRPKELGEDEVTAKVQAILSEVVWLRLWTNQQLDEATTGLSVLKKDPNLDAGIIARLEAWSLLRKGDLEAADAAMKRIAPSDPMGELGLAVLAERAGDRRAAVVKYLDLSQRFSGELLGAYARTRVGVLSGADAPRTDVGRAMEDAAAAVPDWLETILDNPSRVVSLEVEPERSDTRVLERTPLRVTLMNLSAIPMGVGPDRPISSRLMLAPSVEVQATPMGGGDLIEVVSLDRRLRLLPRERFQTVVWGDAGTLGLLQDMSASAPSRVRWRVLQGFRFTPEQIYERGPHSVSTDTTTLTRRPNSRFLADGDALKTSIETGGPRELAEAIISLRARQARTIEALPLSIGEIEAMMDAIAVRFAGADKTTKLLILAVLPPPSVQPESARVDQVAQSDNDPDVLTLLLALRTRDPASPVFALPQVQGSPALSELADVVRARLRDGQITLASSAADVRPPNPPMIGPPVPPSPDRK